VTGRPDVNERVTLIRANGDRASTRVEGGEGGLLAVGEPLGPGWGSEPPIGTPYTMQWPSPRGLVTQDVVLTRAQRADINLWWLELASEPQLHQRRSYVRASVPLAETSTTFHITWLADSRPPRPGRLLDISEGGMRGRLDDWAPLQEGQAVRISVDLEGVDLEVRGNVLRATETRDTVEVVVVFEELPESVAAPLRRVVFDWQRASIVD
jgi:PilZ domain